MYESVAKLPCGEVTVAKLPCGEVTGNRTQSTLLFCISWAVFSVLRTAYIPVVFSVYQYQYIRYICTLYW